MKKNGKKGLYSYKDNNLVLTDWVKKDKNRYCLTLDIKKPADTEANVPDHIIQNIYYTKIEDLLYEEVSYEKRELYPLNSISDHNPKYLLTLDDDPPTSHNGIKQLNAIDWLLK